MKNTLSSCLFPAPTQIRYRPIRWRRYVALSRISYSSLVVESQNEYSVRLVTNLFYRNLISPSQNGRSK